MPSFSPAPRPALLDDVLRAVARRYRVAARPVASAQKRAAYPAAELACVIEEARSAMTEGHAPDTALEDAFTGALARLIHGAMRPAHGDFAFQAMVLRHCAPHVREYASLAAHAGQDRRAVLASVNAIAHPGKQQRLPPGPLRAALAQLQTRAAAEDWTALADGARRSLSLPEVAGAAPVERRLKKLLDDPALAKLQRLAGLAGDDAVRRYEALWDRRGPRSGSAGAAALGKATQQRGAAVEALAAQAMQALARRIGAAQGRPAAYRVVTSLRVPSSIPGEADRAKTEWDVVLLREAPDAGAGPAWDICLVAEVKSSVDAATTDYPRLLRGLRLLAQADADTRYPFATRQGIVTLRGAALQALPTEEDGLAGTVLYCCDAPNHEDPRLLGAASRMQLLSAPESLAYAARLVHGAAGAPADPAALAPVWRKLLSSPQWRAVLQQYATLHRVRELMVHVADLAEAVAAP